MLKDVQRGIQHIQKRPRLRIQRRKTHSNCGSKERFIIMSLPFYFHSLLALIRGRRNPIPLIRQRIRIGLQPILHIPQKIDIGMPVMPPMNRLKNHLIKTHRLLGQPT
ncbi:MAG: hypothetical protein KC917_20925, partial [Candidatus Omnitrophica bacterium]|nr:hypothetical protein [Candidatus Omnitrophota bacterium]